MSSILNMRNSVGFILVISAIIFGTILLFGFMQTGIDKGQINIFRLVYFIFIAIVLGTVYIMKSNSIESIPEHLLLVFAIMLASVGMAFAAGSLKEVYETNKESAYLGSPDNLKAQISYFSDYENVLKEKTVSIQLANAEFEKQIANLTEKINNRKPVIVENIIKLPAKVIYEQQKVPPPRNYDEEEEEDD